ncbi:MAG: PqqD family protein [Candidatus Loosdrechtia sp.]|uniref:PqqD family protein n=1 Tax=Candidatus Loosdrechtia sp. TaxID=3101272 RepID=UPI003A78341C|nr:MAG: PqqD family protein [Candidatus Jettenia sp. AMX2]
MNIIKPLRRHGVFLQDIGREAMLYCTREKYFHILNPTARLIWELCDGKHTIEDMEQAMRNHFSLAAEYNVTEDILQTLNFFSNKGLLETIVQKK